MANTPIKIVNATIEGMNAHISGATIVGEVEEPEVEQPIAPPPAGAPEHPIEEPEGAPEHPTAPPGPTPSASRTKKK
jgi:hypothetical protein